MLRKLKKQYQYDINIMKWDKQVVNLYYFCKLQGFYEKLYSLKVPSLYPFITKDMCFDEIAESCLKSYLNSYHRHIGGIVC